MPDPPVDCAGDMQRREKEPFFALVLEIPAWPSAGHLPSTLLYPSPHLSPYLLLFTLFLLRWYSIQEIADGEHFHPALRQSARSVLAVSPALCNPVLSSCAANHTAMRCQEERGPCLHGHRKMEQAASEHLQCNGERGGSRRWDGTRCASISQVASQSIPLRI